MTTATPAMLDYFADAYAQGCCDVDVHDTAFWLITRSDRHEFPELADTFGASLSPRGLELHATREAYVLAVSRAALAGRAVQAS